jgi:hypothetical protein
MINLDVPCPHTDFNVIADVRRVADADDSEKIIAYCVDVKCWCHECGEAFRWMGVQPGMSFDEPRVDLGGATLTIPMRPSSADPDFGLGLPGFDISIIESEVNSDGPGTYHERSNGD